MYEFHGQLGPAPMGDEPRGWRDTITGGSGESGETLKKLFLVCIIKFSPFPDAVQIHGISSRLSARQNRSGYNLPISRILRFPRQSSFIRCTFQSRNLLSYTNKRSQTKVPFLSLRMARILRRAFGLAPSQLGEQVVGRSPGETPVEQTWPAGSLRYSRCRAKMTGTKQFYIPCDNSIPGLDQYGDLLIRICFPTQYHTVQTVAINYDTAVYVL